MPYPPHPATLAPPVLPDWLSGIDIAGYEVGRGPSVPAPRPQERGPRDAAGPRRRPRHEDPQGGISIDAPQSTSPRGVIDSSGSSSRPAAHEDVEELAVEPEPAVMDGKDVSFEMAMVSDEIDEIIAPLGDHERALLADRAAVVDRWNARRGRTA